MTFETASSDTHPNIELLVTTLVVTLAPEPPQGKTSLDDNIVTELGYHSLAASELMMALEDLFQFVITSANEIIEAKTIAGIIKTVTTRLDVGDGEFPAPNHIDEVFSEYDIFLDD